MMWYNTKVILRGDLSLVNIVTPVIYDSDNMWYLWNEEIYSYLIEEKMKQNCFSYTYTLGYYLGCYRLDNKF